jgi:phosphatidylserine/phosphatidylglycerophosphate/cardiolipin synthase-like enzyme
LLTPSHLLSIVLFRLSSPFYRFISPLVTPPLLFSSPSPLFLCIQIRPHNAIFKSRNCHIKFLAVDGQCAVVGNGNMDSQSFWHSQEANVLIDSPQIVADWMDQLQTNQSTHKYGRVDTDGIWRDPATGEELEKPKAINCFTAMRAVI